jgi:hypothetical protein
MDKVPDTVASLSSDVAGSLSVIRIVLGEHHPETVAAIDGCCCDARADDRRRTERCQCPSWRQET